MVEILCHCEKPRAERSDRWERSRSAGDEASPDKLGDCFGLRPRNDIWLPIISIPFDLASFQSIHQLVNIRFSNIVKR